MIVGVIGLGVVGTAVYDSLCINCTDCTVVGYDKYKNIGSAESVINTDIVFLCLPTLYNSEMKSYDMTAINDVCSLLSSVNYRGIVVVKSTVEPLACEKLTSKYNLFIYHNPEFLSAATAFEDFHNQHHIVIGHTKYMKKDESGILENFFTKYYPNAKITICTSTESESIKIFCNNFYSVKIQFFNELYLLCQKTGADYNIVIQGMLANNWINPMHTIVPGTDGNLSYGGMCFPKDTNALLSFMEKIGSPHMILEATVKERNTMRPN